MSQASWWRQGQLWQHGSKNLETQILFVSKLIGAPLDDADLVVQPFDETQRDFVFRSAVSSDAMPMVLDHLSEFLIGRTSTAWMRSNQLRLYFSSFAYIILMQRLRQLGLKGTELAQAQCETIRLKLFKIGAQVAAMRRTEPERGLKHRRKLTPSVIRSPSRDRCPCDPGLTGSVHDQRDQRPTPATVTAALCHKQGS